MSLMVGLGVGEKWNCCASWQKIYSDNKYILLVYRQSSTFAVQKGMRLLNLFYSVLPTNLPSWWPGKQVHSPITLPLQDCLDFDRSIYSPDLHQDFLNIPVDRDLTAWRKLSIRWLTDGWAESLGGGKEDSVEEFKVVGPGGQEKTIKCAIPAHSPAAELPASSPEPAEREAMIAAALLILKDLKGSGCLKHREGWWTYEVCHFKRIRQFHTITAADQATLLEHGQKVLSLGAISSEFLLGRFLPNQPHSTDIKFGNVFTMTYRDGESCQTADRGVVNRVTEVRLVCSLKNRLAPHFIDVFERRLCDYVITIGVPSLCSIPAFQPWNRPTQTLMCLDMSNGDGLVETSPSSTTSPTVAVNQKSEEPIKLERLQELIDSSSDTSFPLLRQAILELLQTEFAAIFPDTLTSHPRQSMFEVFSELKAEAHSQSKPDQQQQDQPATEKDASEKSDNSEGIKKEDKESEKSQNKKPFFDFRFEL
jgi:hypothetical protein